MWGPLDIFVLWLEPGRIMRYIITNVRWFSCKVPVILVRVKSNLNSLDRFFEKWFLTNFHENSSFGVPNFPCGQTDRHRDRQAAMTKLVVTSCNFANAPKNGHFTLMHNSTSRLSWPESRCINLSKPTGYVMHQQFNIQQLYVLPTLYLCVLIYLRTNSDLCHLQHKLIGFYNRDEKCLLRGTNRVFK